MSLRVQLLILAAAIAGTALLTRYYFPAVESKVEVVEKEVVRTDVRTITKTISKPDGSTETVTETIDKSVAKSNKESTATTFKQPNYIVSIAAGSQLSKLDVNYGLQASVRVLGPFYAGAYGRADGEFGLLLSVEF